MLRLLDLFCCAGGCTRGYQQAGFWVRGVDIEAQPRYVGNEFVQADALEYLRGLIDSGEINDFDAIHASPPCQLHSAMTKGRWKDREHPELIEPTRQLLIEAGLPFVIENVVGAKKTIKASIILCGTMFGLETKHGSQLRRHRLFELSFSADFLLPPCQHNNGSAIGVYGGGQNPARKRPATIGVWGHAGGSSNRDNLIQFGTDDRRDAMGIDWMTGDELSEAIPPAYTEFIGKHLIEHIERERSKSC